MRKHLAAATPPRLLTPLTQLALPTAHAEDLASRFTLGVMPDTQFYARYGTEAAGDIFGDRYGSNPYDAQTEFLAANHDKLGTQFVTHLGDVVDQPDDRASWDIADRAMKKLEDAGVNYSVLPGNHDLTMFSDNSAFNEYFPEERAKKNSTYMGRTSSTGIYERGTGDKYSFPGQSVESEYHIFEAEGQKYLVLALGFRANDDTLDWAQDVIDAHPELPVILTAHEISGIGGDGSTYFTEEYGQHLWDKLIRKNDQIFLTIAGHHHGAGYHVEKNDAGHDVINILQDYQMAYLGGNGLMGQLQFDLSHNQLEMVAYSPWVKDKKYEQLTSFDHLIMDGKGDSYTVDFNFAERFKAFAPDFEAGDANDPDYNEALKQTLTDGYKAYEVTEKDKPKNEQDYAHVDGTVVHWRPGQTEVEGKLLNDGDSAPAGAVIPDVARGDDMTRVRHRVGAGADAVTFSADKHPLSSDRGSLQWKDPKYKHSTAWFETATGAAINSEEFENGYTVEAFLKLDDDWNADNNKWSNALIRDASGTITHPEDEDGDPIQMLGVSSLRELRWYSYGDNGKGFSNWTHEVPKGKWMHIAVVNDPADKSVTMYVDGSPILRDGYGPLGMGGNGDKWLLGTSAWDNDKVDGWFGNIGEIRMVDHPIGPDQWLTARGAAPAPTTTPATTTTTAAPATTTVQVPTPVVSTVTTTVPTTVATTVTAEPEAAGSSDSSSNVGSSIGAFTGGVLVGALGLIIAMLAGMGGSIQWLLDQVRPYLPQM
ncbi:cell wall anchor domain protein [Corynebacterium wankanglinii]|nr:cell wall anchor domain protein [Corynebacterium wankanglinii]